MLTHRLVVPSALVELLRAEHTTATLCLFKLGLKMSITALESRRNTHSTTWSIMLKQNFPTLVPPNFWMTQLFFWPPGEPLSIDSEAELAGGLLSMVKVYNNEGQPHNRAIE